MTKSPKKAWHKNKQDNFPVEKDDGTRWQVVRNGRVVYHGEGLTKAQAHRLADGLVDPAEIRQLK